MQRARVGSAQAARAAFLVAKRSAIYSAFTDDTRAPVTAVFWTAPSQAGRVGAVLGLKGTEQGCFGRPTDIPRTPLFATVAFEVKPCINLF